MAELIIYNDRNFGGIHTHIFGTVEDLTKLAVFGIGNNGGNWNDTIASFVILSGIWRFFKDINHASPQGGVSGPGLYAWVEDHGVDNDSISLLRLVSG